MKKVAFHTLGCKLNFSESSTIARTFEEQGFIKVDFDDRPDVFVINTCSVTENADRKCRKVVRDAKRVSPHSFVALIGCYAQLRSEEISKISGVDAVFGAAEKFKILELLDNFNAGDTTKVFASAVDEAIDFHTSFSYKDRTRTFLKIQDGCNYGCAFCTIPLARGKSRSDTLENVVAEVEKLADTEVKEIVLTGVNTGDFGIQNGKRKETFFDLVQALDIIEGIERFRISSIEPNLLTKELIDFVAHSVRFVPHFHIPLQSGSDRILEGMNRRYRTNLYSSRVEYIKAVLPQACIGVDVIVGFPGETETEFKQTYEYLNQLPVSYLHVFSYSERPNTRAVDMNGVVPRQQRDLRSRMLRILSDKKRRQFYEDNLNEVKEVLVENDIKKNRMYGFTDNYIRISLPHEAALVNSIVPVNLLSINGEGTVDGLRQTNEMVAAI